MFLTGVNGVFHVRNAVYRSPGSSVSILKYLASLEVPRLLGVSRASPKESKRTSLVPDWSQWCISRLECSMHVCRKLCINFKVSGFLISNHLLCVSRASSKESKRTSLVPDWSQWCISRQECSLQVSRKLCINFEVSSFIRSATSPRCLQSVLQGV